MNIYDTHISCGIRELANIGSTLYETRDGQFGQGDYESVMSLVRGKCGLLIASLTTNQPKAIEFLLKNGWQRLGNAVINPNSNHTIMLFVKYLGTIVAEPVINEGRGE